MSPLSDITNIAAWWEQIKEKVLEPFMWDSFLNAAVWFMTHFLSLALG